MGEQIPHDTGVFLVLTVNLHEKIVNKNLIVRIDRWKKTCTDSEIFNSGRAQEIFEGLGISGPIEHDGINHLSL